MNTTLAKVADLAGPGVGNYDELEKMLPQDYEPLLNRKDAQRAITLVKRYIEDGLCRELNLIRVEVPLSAVPAGLQQATVWSAKYQ